MIVLNDHGGQRMDVTEDVTTTLRAEAHHPPIILVLLELITNRRQLKETEDDLLCREEIL